MARRGQRVHRVALKRDSVGGPFAQVCEFKRVVNVAQVHVFLDGLAEESVVPGKRIYCSRLATKSLTPGAGTLAGQSGRFSSASPRPNLPLRRQRAMSVLSM